MIISAFSDRELFFEVLKRKETVRSIKLLIIFPMAALDLPVMPWCVRFDELVTDPKLCQGLLEECRLRAFRAYKAIGKFRTIVCLDTLDRIRKALDAMLDEQGRGIGAVFRECLQIAKPTVFVDKSLLIPLSWL